jgi:hypothetical protein
MKRNMNSTRLRRALEFGHFVEVLDRRIRLYVRRVQSLSKSILGRGGLCTAKRFNRACERPPAGRFAPRLSPFVRGTLKRIPVSPLRKGGQPCSQEEGNFRSKPVYSPPWMDKEGKARSAGVVRSMSRSILIDIREANLIRSARFADIYKDASRH